MEVFNKEAVKTDTRRGEAMWRHREKTAIYKPRGRNFWEETNLADSLFLESSSFQNYEKISVCCSGQPVWRFVNDNPRKHIQSPSQISSFHPVGNIEARGGNAIHPSGRVQSSVQGSWLQASGWLSLDHAASSIMKYWPSPCLQFSLFKQFAATKANWPLFAFLSNDFLPELSDPAETSSTVLPCPSRVLPFPVLTAQARKIEFSSHSGDTLRNFSDSWWWKCHGAFRQKSPWGNQENRTMLRREGLGLVRSQDKDKELNTGFDHMEGMTDLDKSS